MDMFGIWLEISVLCRAEAVANNIAVATVYSTSRIVNETMVVDTAAIHVRCWTNWAMTEQNNSPVAISVDCTESFRSCWCFAGSDGSWVCRVR